MRLNNYINRNDLLIDWMLSAMPDGIAVLDVGANDGSFCPEVRRIAQRARVFAGVDPDSTKLDRNPLLTHRYPTTLETASIPDNSFDLVYAIYVLEHVVDDHGFVRAIARILRPGGSFFFITPNGAHYFAAVAATLAKIGLQRKVLSLIRPTRFVEQYHYPALYRLNKARKLMRLGRAAGFSDFEFRYSEKFEEFVCYFPGPLWVFPWLWERMVESTGEEWLLGNLMGRMVRGPL